MVKLPPSSQSPDFDIAKLEETIRRAKVQLRKRMKALRGAHSASALALRSERITQRLAKVQAIQEARGVALFWPMADQGEVDLRSLDAELRKSGKKLFYPFMIEKEPGRYGTGFSQTESSAELVLAGRGFMQPAHTTPAQPGDVDVVIVPALAADIRGHRIGYGAGFYDATLADICPPARSIIVAYHFQLLAELPNEEHDRACDGVLTDENEYWVETAN